MIRKSGSETIRQFDTVSTKPHLNHQTINIFRLAFESSNQNEKMFDAHTGEFAIDPGFANRSPLNAVDRPTCDSTHGHDLIYLVARFGYGRR